MATTVKVGHPCGKITFHKMEESQISEHILMHIPERKDRRAFNFGGAVTIDGFTYKVVLERGNTHMPNA